MLSGSYIRIDLLVREDIPAHIKRSASGAFGDRKDGEAPFSVEALAGSSGTLIFATCSRIHPSLLAAAAEWAGAARTSSIKRLLPRTPAFSSWPFPGALEPAAPCRRNDGPGFSLRCQARSHLLGRDAQQAGCLIGAHRRYAVRKHLGEGPDAFSFLPIC